MGFPLLFPCMKAGLIITQLVLFDKGLYMYGETSPSLCSLFIIPTLSRFDSSECSGQPSLGNNWILVMSCQTQAGVLSKYWTNITSVQFDGVIVFGINIIPEAWLHQGELFSLLSVAWLDNSLSRSRFMFLSFPSFFPCWHGGERRTSLLKTVTRVAMNYQLESTVYYLSIFWAVIRLEHYVQEERAF